MANASKQADFCEPLLQKARKQLALCEKLGKKSHLARLKEIVKAIEKLAKQGKRTAI
jgi:hypothetical protein